VIQPLEPNVGLRIRELRNRRGIALRALAEKCGLSANAISLIERGETSPTVSSLHQLATALEVPITDFFEEKTAVTSVHVKQDRGLRFRSKNLEMENLGTGLPNQQLQPFRMTIEPGSETISEPVTHPGQEFVYCLEGEIEYFVADQRYQLKSGDSLLLEATQPHNWRNTTQRKAANLHQKMVEVNAVKKLVRRLPAETQVSDWVEQAKALPRKILY
jgi:transcriptional regulator with XRE-family HTH domain